jgi:hypothetical protein
MQRARSSVAISLVHVVAVTAMAAAGLSAALPLVAQDTTVVSCPRLGHATSDVSHGFYVTGYGGSNLDTVSLGFATDTPGEFIISLTARRNAYDGPMIGTTETAIVNVGMGTDTVVTFSFGAAPVSPGDTVAFLINAGQLTSVNNEFGNLYYDLGQGTCAGVFETQGTSPPLDTVIFAGVGVAIGAAGGVNSLGFPCVPSDTVLCLDDDPGDHRFAVTASFSTVEGTVHAGKGQAVSLAALGTDHGGLFWFFSPQTPDLLVNVINGCALNNHYWVFLSSPTNVGYTVVVNDTAYVGSKTYVHADLAAQSAVQDTMALADCQPCTSNAECPSGLLCCSLPADRRACIQPTPAGTCPAYP